MVKKHRPEVEKGKMEVKANKRLVKLILVKCKQICNSENRRTKAKGRPYKYPDHIILFALMLKILRGLSLRDLEEALKDYFPKCPDHTTFHYRFRKLQNLYLQNLIEDTAKEIMKKLKAKQLYCLIADGTGFGYSDTFKLSWIRGKKKR